VIEDRPLSISASVASLCADSREKPPAHTPSPSKTLCSGSESSYSSTPVRAQRLVPTHAKARASVSSGSVHQAVRAHPPRRAAARAPQRARSQRDSIEHRQMSTTAATFASLTTKRGSSALARAIAQSRLPRAPRRMTSAGSASAPEPVDVLIRMPQQLLVVRECVPGAPLRKARPRGPLLQQMLAIVEDQQQPLACKRCTVSSSAVCGSQRDSECACHVAAQDRVGSAPTPPAALRPRTRLELVRNRLRQSRLANPGRPTTVTSARSGSTRARLRHPRTGRRGLAARATSEGAALSSRWRRFGFCGLRRCVVRCQRPSIPAPGWSQSPEARAACARCLFEPTGCSLRRQDRPDQIEQLVLGHNWPARSTSARST